MTSILIMTTPHLMEQSRAIPVDFGTAFGRTLAVSLPKIFRRRYGPIGPVKAVRDQTGDWTTVGQTRTVRPSRHCGAGSLARVLSNSPANSYAE